MTATVVQHDRNLSLAGLRTVGGRGLAVARVTYQDAANLLIAVAASRNVKDSVKTVREYIDLTTPRGGLKFGNEVRGNSFGDALAALLEAVPASRDSFSGSDGDRITVSLYGPAPSARIEAKQRAQSEDLSWKYYDLRPSSGQDHVSGDLTYIAQFTEVTLGHVGTLIAKEA